MLYFIFLSCPIKVVTNCKHQVAGQYVCIAFNAPDSGYFTAIGIGLRQKVVRFEMNTEVVIYISDVINKAAALPPRTPLSKYRELLPDKWKQKNIAQEFEYANVSIPVAILIWLMIYPMMLKVDFQSVKNVGKRPRGIIVTCVTNWLIKPFTMFGIAYLFFYVIFKTNKLNKICICCY